MILTAALIAVAALLLGISPGLAIIGVAIAALILDAYDPGLLDRLMNRAV